MLWRLLHGTSLPPQATRELLLDGATVGGLRRAVLARPSGDWLSVASWSARWLVDPHAASCRSKKDEIENCLAMGR
eukprot:3300060-Lingulodinium_polyedra.AAC.1